MRWRVEKIRRCRWTTTITLSTLMTDIASHRHLLTSLSLRSQTILGVLAWPLGCLAAGTLLWSMMQSNLDERERNIEADAVAEATHISRGYALQTEKTLERINRTLLTLKFYWAFTDGHPGVEEQLQEGLFPASAMLYVALSDPDGNLRSSSLADCPQLADPADFPALTEHTSPHMVIGTPLTCPVAGKTLIRFAQRLETSDGKFDGLVVIAAEPDYLSIFQDKMLLGEHDFITLATRSGTVLASTSGTGGQQQKLYQHIPFFSGDNGTTHMAGNQFIDGEERIVAWNTVPGYALQTVSALTTKEIFASFRKLASDYRKRAVLGSVGLFLLACAGTFLALRRANRRLEMEHARRAYGMASDSDDDGFYMWRAIRDNNERLIDFNLLDCNERGASLLGTTRSALVDRNLSAFYHGEYFERLLQSCHRTIETGYLEDDYQVPENSPFQATWLRRKIIRTQSGLAMTVRDISAVKAHELVLFNQANRDDLTGLPNRHWMHNNLAATLLRAADNQQQVAILFLDIDNFKNINDTLGHPTGDLLLQAAAQRLQTLAGPTTACIRFGGDAFLVILGPMASDELVRPTAERILQGFSTAFLLPAQDDILTSVSIGISCYPQDGESAEALIKHADIAMHAAKSEGKTRLRFYQPELLQRLTRRVEYEYALRLALDRDEFVLHYQPRVTAIGGELSSMEALVRWQHPQYGLIQPQEFIAIVEESGLIGRLGELVIRKACAQMAQWQKEGLPLLPVSINVSSQQLNQGNLEALIASCTRQYAIASSQIELELTESCMMDDTEAISAELSSLQRLGIKLLVDDFGTGYSSLSQLQKLDLDILKVDQSFTAELGKQHESKVLFRAIVSMAHALNMTTVAEGVETQEQLDLLRELGCDEVQGFFISRPLPPAELPALMRKRYMLA